jgi:hypothetical protein
MHLVPLHRSRCRCLPRTVGALGISSRTPSRPGGAGQEVVATYYSGGRRTEDGGPPAVRRLLQVG